MATTDEFFPPAVTNEEFEQVVNTTITSESETTPLPSSSPPANINALDSQQQTTVQFPQEEQHLSVSAPALGYTPSYSKTSTLPTRETRLSVRSVASSSADSLNTDYTGPVIPPNSDPKYNFRTLVLCFDGTGDEFDEDNSNVVLLFSLLKKGDHSRQLVYYQPGVGTYTLPQTTGSVPGKMSKLLDLMFATTLKHHVISGYNFLMQNYKIGDKICIFGFSRGAYTARALAGMIHKVGLLPPGNEQQVAFAYKMYQRDTNKGWKQSILFKKTFCIDVDIEFVGVWDTVASVGLIDRNLPFTKSNTAIKTFRHALSLNEHRVKFKPSLHLRITEAEARRGDFVPPPPVSQKAAWTRERVQEAVSTSQSGPLRTGRNTTVKTTATATVTKTQSSSGSPGPLFRPKGLRSSLKRSANAFEKAVDEASSELKRISSEERRHLQKIDGDNSSTDTDREKLELMYLDRSRKMDVKEVWFAGCHCDIGGGSVGNGTPHSLARIPLRWMIRECFRTHTGIQFDADRLRDVGLDPSNLYPTVRRRPPAKSIIPAEIALADREKRATIDKKVHDKGATESKLHRTVEAETGGRRQVTLSVEGTLAGTVGRSEEPGRELQEEIIQEERESSDSMAKGTARSEDTQEHEQDREQSDKLLTEEDEDNLDAIQPIYDQLQLKKWWWIVEYLPMRERVPQEDGTTKKRWTQNRGRHRIVPEDHQPINIHRSVRSRLEANQEKYKIPVNCRDIVWVD